MAVWLKEDRYDIAVKVVLFIISPFLSFIFSLRTIKTRSSFLVFFLFSVFFGLAFTVTSGTDSENYIDGMFYRQKFESFQYLTVSEYLNGLEGYFSFSEGSKDYYFDTIAFLVSRITDNYHLMFMVLAMVFAFFSLKSFKFLTSENNFKASLSCNILAYLFMINQIFNINGVRFWTAAWVGVYCIFQIFRNDNKRYFLLVLLTPFFHGSFWIFVAVVAFAYFSKRSHKTWVVLFFISFFISNISVEFVRAAIDSLPPFLGRMAQTYTDAEYIEERAAGGTGFYWVAEMFRYLVGIYINLLVFLFIKNSKLILGNTKTSKLFPFLLIWMTFVNVTMAIPSLGGRFIMLSYPIMAYIWLVNFSGRKYRKVLYAMPFVFLFSFYAQAMLYKQVLDPFFYFSSPFYLFYYYLYL